MQTIYQLRDRLEAEEDVISVTLMLGFPPGDVECNGPSVLVYANSQEKADWVADQLFNSFLEQENKCLSSLVGIDQAVSQAIQLSKHTKKPIILADVQDNPGGGSGSDSVWILEELLRCGVRDAAIGLLYDPEAARAAHQVGEGATITLDLGGKMIPGHKPEHGEYEIIKLLEGEIEGTGPMSKGMQINLGKMALLRRNGIYISVASQRIQAADQAVFTAFGLDPTQMKILVLKSFVHFRAAFTQIAGEIIEVEAPGAEFDNPTAAHYTHLREGIRLGGNGSEFRKRDYE